MVTGDPEATKYHEMYRLIKFLHPTKKDVFLDLGCGIGNTCKWISKKVKLEQKLTTKYWAKTLIGLLSRKMLG